MIERTSPTKDSRWRVAPTAQRRAGEAAKRVLDLAIAVLALAALGPLMLGLAAAIKLDSPGPVLFRQRRIGRGGQPFTILKLRSMYVDANDAIHRQAVRNFATGRPVAMVKGKPSFKSARDPRVTRVGKLLRATGLDELPQLLNVVRAEMSLVGPRPAIPYELEYYQDWHYKRFAVRPGITGLWQLTRASAAGLDDMMRLDIEYIDSFSIWLDLKIILATVPKIFLRRWAF